MSSGMTRSEEIKRLMGFEPGTSRIQGGCTTTERSTGYSEQFVGMKAFESILTSAGHVKLTIKFEYFLTATFYTSS